jgi:hypothetical protein
LAELEQRRSAALDALTFQFKNVSERIRAALAEQADDAVAACDEAEEQIRKLRLGIAVLDEKARAIELTLTDPFLDPARWNEPEAQLRPQARPHPAGSRDDLAERRAWGVLRGGRDL